MPGTPQNLFYVTQSVQWIDHQTGVIRVHTNIPCHLYCRMTIKPPQFHPQSKNTRGLNTLEGKRICVTAYEDNDQVEPGDTYEHTFIKPNWPVCQTRYWYYIASILGLSSLSTSAIFNLHHAAVLPPTEGEIMATPKPKKLIPPIIPYQKIKASVKAAFKA